MIERRDPVHLLPRVYFYGPRSITFKLENLGLSVLHSSLKSDGNTFAVKFNICSKVHELSLHLGICKRYGSVDDSFRKYTYK